MSGTKKRVEKKVIKEKPRHPRPLKGVRWSEKKEVKPAHKRKKKLDKEKEKDLFSR